MSKSYRSSSNSSSFRSRASALSVRGVTSTGIWKVTFAMLVVAAILMGVLISRVSGLANPEDPNSPGYETNYRMAVSAVMLRFIAVWAGIAVMMYRIYHKMPVAMYTAIGFALTFLLPTIVIFATMPGAKVQPAKAQILGALSFPKTSR